jgi:hypothetical protein
VLVAGHPKLSGYRPGIPRFGRRRKTTDLSIDELYRRYALVMEQAQRFEQIIRGHAQRHEFASLREMGSSPTVLPRMERIEGKTIGWVEHRYELPQDAKELVKLARELRNDLAHNFFEAIDKHSAEGRLRAAGKLLAYSRVFSAASRALADWRPEPDALTPS